MRISAKADYAVRAMIELAAAGDGAVVKGERLAGPQDIPLHFLENILSDLKQAGIVATRRGPEGGYRLTSVRGESPEALSYDGSAEPLQQVWIALRGGVRGVLEAVSLEDLVRGKLPGSVARLARDPDAWARR